MIEPPKFGNIGPAPIIRIDDELEQRVLVVKNARTIHIDETQEERSKSMDFIEKTLPATPGMPDLKAGSARHCCLDCRHWLSNDSTFEHGLCRAVDDVISRNTRFDSVCDAFKGM